MLAPRARCSPRSARSQPCAMCMKIALPPPRTRGVVLWLSTTTTSYRWSVRQRRRRWPRREGARTGCNCGRPGASHQPSLRPMALTGKDVAGRLITIGAIQHPHQLPTSYRRCAVTLALACAPSALPSAQGKFRTPSLTTPRGPAADSPEAMTIRLRRSPGRPRACLSIPTSSRRLQGLFRLEN